MFDFVHEKKRLVQIVLALIVLPFAFWGVDSYRQSGGAEPLATVDGEKVTQREFDEALALQTQRIREMAGGRFDPTFFDKPEIKQSILDNLVSQHLVAQASRKAGLSLTDEQLAQVIANIGAFQKEGKFDAQRYESVLAEKGLGRRDFEARVRQELITRQLTEAYLNNGYASDTVSEALIRLNEQKRIIAVATLGASAFARQVKLGKDEVQAYYDANPQEFHVPAQVKVDYVTLSADALQAKIKVADADVNEYYLQHQAEFGTQEQRQAAHILFAVSPQATAEEKSAAQAQAEAVLKQVKQTPSQFAALAKQHSQDPGSAANGGDLGMFGRGAMVKPFEDSVFSLKTGEISGLVQSDFGYHIIKLLAVKPAKVQPLAEVEGMIAQRLVMQMASDRFAELAEKFSNMAYEQSDSLKPAAELAQAAVQGGVWLSQGQAPSGLFTDKIMSAVFSDDALKNKRNTAAIEVAPNVLLTARVVDHKEAHLRPLTEVAAAIQKKLLQTEAAKLAQEFGAKQLAQLQQGAAAKLSWKGGQTVSRNQHSTLAPELLEAVYRADTQKLPAYVGVTSPEGYLIARIDAVKDVANIDEMKRSGYGQQIRQLTGEELLMSFMADARKHADITVKTFTEQK